MLEMPSYALGILESRAEWPTMPFEANFLKGEALRCLDRYREALFAGWTSPRRFGPTTSPSCWLRAGAISGRIGWPRPSTHLSGPPGTSRRTRLIHYNLACYWSLAANASKALEELTVALA